MILYYKKVSFYKTMPIGAFIFIVGIYGCMSPVHHPEKDYKQYIDKEITMDGMDNKIILFKDVFDLSPCARFLIKQMIITLKRGDHVLDITAEAGYAALAAARNGAARVVATDINPLAVENILFNSGRFGFTGIIEEHIIDRNAENMAFDNVNEDDTFDIILFKEPCGKMPPFIRDNNEHNRLKEEIFITFLQGLKAHLKPSGTAMVLIDKPYKYVNRYSSKAGINLTLLPNSKGCNIYYYTR